MLPTRESCAIVGIIDPHEAMDVFHGGPVDAAEAGATALYTEGGCPRSGGEEEEGDGEGEMHFLRDGEVLR